MVTIEVLSVDNRVVETILETFSGRVVAEEV